MAYKDPYDLLSGYGTPGVDFTILAHVADTDAESECLVEKLELGTFNVHDVAQECVIGGVGAIKKARAKIMVSDEVDAARGFFDRLGDLFN